MSDRYAVVVGSMNCDMIFMQDRLPERGETLLVDSVNVASGGKGANQAVQLAKLGAETYFIAKCGRDLFGDYLLGQLNGYGVNTEGVFRGETTSGVAAVLTMRDGVYYSNVAPGANMTLSMDEIEQKKELIKGAAIAVFQSEIDPEVCEQTIRFAHENGVYVIVNAAPARYIANETLKCIDALIVNESEASFYSGVKVTGRLSALAASEVILPMTGGTLVITLGENGSLLYNNEGKTYFYTDPNITAVETTGSGDSFVAAFGFMKMKNASDEEACTFANQVSQLTVMKVGGQPSMPSLDEVNEYWRTDYC